MYNITFSGRNIYPKIIHPSTLIDPTFFIVGNLEWKLFSVHNSFSKRLAKLLLKRLVKTVKFGENELFINQIFDI